MSTEEHAAPTDPEFLPENVELLGFIGGWDCYIGIDTIQALFYLIRTKDQDWLEAVVKYSGRIMSRNCVLNIPRHGWKREAAVRLLDAYVRSRVHSAQFRHISQGYSQTVNWKASSRRLPTS